MGALVVSGIDGMLCHGIIFGDLLKGKVAGLYNIIDLVGLFDVLYFLNLSVIIKLIAEERPGGNHVSAPVFCLFFAFFLSFLFVLL